MKGLTRTLVLSLPFWSVILVHRYGSFEIRKQQGRGMASIGFYSFKNNVNIGVSR